MITREQVADLREGDVVRIAEMGARTEDTVTIQGPVRRGQNGHLILGGYTIAEPDGTPTKWGHTLTVVSRSPRPALYVNHPRTEPVPGDVAKDADGQEPSGHTWHYLGDDELGGNWWRFDDRIKNCQPKRLVLLVDGETGQVVQ